ncbi:MAG: hypothetical protein ACC656_14880 [Candidatus Heimdallarchaeota archaeon]
MTISLDRNIAIDLIQTKLEILDKQIAAILKKWEYDNIDDFLADGRAGKLEEVENDGIDMTNLRDKRNEIANLLNSG